MRPSKDERAQEWVEEEEEEEQEEADASRADHSEWTGRQGSDYYSTQTT